MSGFVLVSVILPTANLTNSILTPRDASKRKTQRIAVMETSKQTGSEISDYTRPKKPQHPSKSTVIRGILKSR